MNTKNMDLLIMVGKNNSSCDLKGLDGNSNESWGNQFFNNLEIQVGNNTTPPTPLDYSFTKESGLDKINNSITYCNISSYSSSITGYLTISTTYQNNTANEISVSEVAFVTTYSNGALLAREVLDTPVKIGAGESYAFSMTII